MSKEYDSECIGEIVEVREMGEENNPLVLVKYDVDNVTYNLTESLIMKKDEPIKVGFIRVGYKLKSLMEINTGTKPRPGNKVRVRYLEKNPKKAYLPENDKNFSFY
ncbi:MAG: hypothetical protein IKQ35_04515 [Bacilli bacterium]|nr:hypothetical protein [Bacilli bacterium]